MPSPDVRPSEEVYARTYGIRINAVCPGYIRTPMVKGVIDSNPGLEEWFITREPVGRLGTPEEVAEAVVWLCSDAASFVTGHIMPVDGGGRCTVMGSGNRYRQSRLLSKTLWRHGNPTEAVGLLPVGALWSQLI